MKKSVIIPAALLAALLGAFFLFFAQKQPPQETSVITPTAEPGTESAPTEPQYPLAELATAATEEPTVTSDAEGKPQVAAAAEDVDAAMARLLAMLGDRSGKSGLFILDHFIPRFVVTIDNLPNKELPRKQLPVKGVGGLFLIQGGNEGDRINPYNAQRYTPYVNLAEALGTPELVDLYVRLYPLLQKAFDDLGHPKSYFNDRLIAVIDHLLATPEPTEPIFLKRPNVLYQYADPDLEGRSAGQKILLRVGAENRARLKAKLQHLRAELLTRVIAPSTEKREP